MKPIPISSCHVCNKETWQIMIGNSNGEYKCIRCGRITRKILKRRKERCLNSM